VRAGNETDTVPVGAYGVRLHGLDEARGSLAPAPPGWPLLEVVVRVGRADGAAKVHTETEGCYPLGHGRGLVVHRDSRRAVYTSPQPFSPDELIHPFLAPAAAMCAWWDGHEVFHASAIVVSGGVWALLGEKEAGKSSTAAWLARSGFDIVADDMLVVVGTTALAGPRCIDLRPDAARVLDEGRFLDIGGPRERWRVALPPIAPELPLRGWLLLSWADRLELTAVPAADRLRRLASHRVWRSKLADPTWMLELASLPMWDLRRPGHWSSLGASADLVLEAAARAER